MPAEACPGTVHRYGYDPLRTKVTRSVSDWPCESSFVERPLILKLCCTEPAFVTLNRTTPRLALFAFMVNLNSVALTLTRASRVWCAGRACAGAAADATAPAASRPIVSFLIAPPPLGRLDARSAPAVRQARAHEAPRGPARAVTRSRLGSTLRA